MESHRRKLLEYVQDDGRVPFRDWLDSLKDRQARAIVDARLTRGRLGNFGHFRSVGCGVMELKIDYGRGLRVYLGKDADTVVVLLCGGDKGTQAADIKKAHVFWSAYKEN